MASRFKEHNENEYEEEEEDINRKFSVIRFKSFYGQISEFEWDKRLLEGENAEAIAIGDHWCAVATSLLNIRVFTL